MDTIQVEIKVNNTFNTDIEISDVIEAINEAPIQRRWNYIAQIINEVKVDLTGLTEEQKEIIKKYLTDSLKQF